MSWDVSLYKFTRRYSNIQEIPGVEQPYPPGPLSEVQTAVSDVFPGTNWNAPVWGIYDSEFGSIEFNVGKDDLVPSLALHVRASNAIVGGILRLCERLGCQAIDISDSSFLDQCEHPAAGLERWREYRDQVIERLGANCFKLFCFESLYALGIESRQ
ncbi:conserved hypothetical protein [Paraburkholderia piptadeniae]|uniref:Uncharacterized protein n=1 Tax=Paraburkholderia piptadeniae TaxID=1701573 RepID=A0A1N7RUJ8_9BURK|nr:hypothetical protein [Paraburkholderia piptadeniae]SIT38796.1 conserved hypothetical protein [Paraburkholderia piptadeniae]